MEESGGTMCTRAFDFSNIGVAWHPREYTLHISLSFPETAA
jgi:hypothetical protein